MDRCKHWFGFGGIDPICLYTFIYRPPHILYLLYRMLTAGYCLAWMIDFSKEPEWKHSPLPWMVYLTNLGYAALTTYMMTHFVLTLGYGLNESRFNPRYFISRPSIESIYNSYHKIHQIQTGIEPKQMTCCSLKALPHVIIWIMFNTMTVIAPFVTIVFFAAIYPRQMLATMDTINTQEHLLNAIIMLLENLLTATPIRFLHVLYPMIFALGYVVFSFIYWSMDHSRVLYQFLLDWNNPGRTVGFMFLVGLVVFPIIQLIFFGIYKVRAAIVDYLAAPSNVDPGLPAYMINEHNGYYLQGQAIQTQFNGQPELSRQTPMPEQPFAMGIHQNKTHEQSNSMVIQNHTHEQSITCSMEIPNRTYEQSTNIEIQNSTSEQQEQDVSVRL